MKRTKLDENSLGINSNKQEETHDIVYPDNVTLAMAIRDGQMIAYLGSHGFQVGVTSSAWE